MNDLSTLSKLLTQPTKIPVMRYLLSVVGGLVIGALLVVGGEYAAGYRVVDGKTADYYEEFLRFMDSEETHMAVKERMEMEEKHERTDFRTWLNAFLNTSALIAIFVRQTN